MQKQLMMVVVLIIIILIGYSGCITTDEKLQERAETVGTNREVSTGVTVDTVTGLTNAEKTVIEHIAITVRPRAGSRNINLSNCTVSVLYDTLTILNLNRSLVQSPDDNGVFYTPIKPGSNKTIINCTSNTTFGISVVYDSDDSIINNFNMNSGDQAILLINLSAIIDSGGLSVRQSISGTITPENGIKAQYYITAPAVFSNRIVDLWLI